MRLTTRRTLASLLGVSASLIALLGTNLAVPAAPRPHPTLWPTTRPATTPPHPLPRHKVSFTLAARRYRRAIGVLGAALCYTAYEALKGAADGLTRRGYQRPDVQRRMIAARRTLNAARTQLVSVGTLPLAPQDRRALGAIVAVLTLLEEEARGLARFAKTQKRTDFALFERLRQKSWRRLRKLLAP